jgi:hypothetical protein
MAKYLLAYEGGSMPESEEEQHAAVAVEVYETFDARS